MKKNYERLFNSTSKVSNITDDEGDFKRKNLSVVYYYNNISKLNKWLLNGFGIILQNKWLLSNLINNLKLKYVQAVFRVQI